MCQKTKSSPKKWGESEKMKYYTGIRYTHICNAYTIICTEYNRKETRRRDILSSTIKITRSYINLTEEQRSYDEDTGDLQSYDDASPMSSPKFPSQWLESQMGYLYYHIAIWSMESHWYEWSNTAHVILMRGLVFSSLPLHLCQLMCARLVGFIFVFKYQLSWTGQREFHYDLSPWTVSEFAIHRPAMFGDEKRIRLV